MVFFKGPNLPYSSTSSTQQPKSRSMGYFKGSRDNSGVSTSPYSDLPEAVIPEDNLPSYEAAVGENLKQTTSVTSASLDST